MLHSLLLLSYQNKYLVLYWMGAFLCGGQYTITFSLITPQYLSTTMNIAMCQKDDCI